MEVAIVLVNWNQSQVTIRCLESLVENTGKDASFSYHIVIVDNNSEAESIQLLEAYLAKAATTLPIHLIKNEVNAGFAGGNNMGIKFALENHDPDYIWILNNDIIVQKGALNQLVNASRAFPTPKIWGSTIYELHPELHFHCAGGFSYNAFLSIPTPITFPAEQAIPTGLYHPLPTMDYPAGASMFIRADTFKEYGLLNETYFLYYEELDFVAQIGGKSHLAWCPDSVLHHQSGQSTGSKNPNKGEGSWIAHYYGNLSALKYTWLHHLAFFPFVFGFRFGIKSVLFAWNRDFKSFQPLAKAYLDFFKWVIGQSH